MSDQNFAKIISEDVLQAKCWEWAWNTYPQLRRKFWAVPNGGWRNAIEASKLKATGTLEGVWDMHCYVKKQFYIIEFKVGGNQLTVDRVVKGKKHFGQKEWGEIMEAEGAIKFVCRTEDEFKNVFNGIVSGLWLAAKIALKLV